MQEWYTLSLHHCHVVMMQHALAGVFHLQFPTLTYLMGNQQIGIYTYPSRPLDELVCPLRAHKPWALSTSISNCRPCVTLFVLPIRVVVNWASSLQGGYPHKQFLNLTLYCSTLWSIMILKILPHASTHTWLYEYSKSLAVPGSCPSMNLAIFSFEKLFIPLTYISVWLECLVMLKMCDIHARIMGAKAGCHFFFNYDNEPFPDHRQSLEWLLYSLLLLIWSKLLSSHLFHFHHQSSQWRILDKRHHTWWLTAVTSEIYLLFMSCFKN